jgi:hypothetical protein
MLQRRAKPLGPGYEYLDRLVARCRSWRQLLPEPVRTSRSTGPDAPRQTPNPFFRRAPTP